MTGRDRVRSDVAVSEALDERNVLAVPTASVLSSVGQTKETIDRFGI